MAESEQMGMLEKYGATFRNTARVKGLCANIANSYARVKNKATDPKASHNQTGAQQRLKEYDEVLGLANNFGILSDAELETIQSGKEA